MEVKGERDGAGGSKSGFRWVVTGVKLKKE